MKIQIFNVLKLLLIVHILISSGAALYDQITGSKIDPIKAILKFQTQPQNTGDTTQTKDVEYTMFHIIQAYTKGAQQKDLTAESSFKLSRTGGNILAMVN